MCGGCNIEAYCSKNCQKKHWQKHKPNCLLCPICFENIGKTITVTECGHKFHTGCLMKNVAKNGFACPCCRALMVPEAAPKVPEETWEDTWDTPQEPQDVETYGENWIYNRLYSEIENETEEKDDWEDWVNAVVYGANGPPK
jgi:hypothetical protein